MRNGLGEAEDWFGEDGWTISRRDGFKEKNRLVVGGLAVAAAAVVGVRSFDRSVLNQKRWIAFLDRGYFWIAVEVAFCIDRFLERVADSKKMSTIRLDVEKFSGKKQSFQEGKKGARSWLQQERR
ncbi:hypothetical protein SASPL_105877 [Salvia splendens]|uniref:Uncharacterized protein n=1 Tax=Salvia splendens TaxID=180675 RepID=A0A8X8YRB8_SALSN|nr:hypothetical protein SASPL_105877 [Salvia splendens]